MRCRLQPGHARRVNTSFAILEDSGVVHRSPILAVLDHPFTNPTRPQIHARWRSALHPLVWAYLLCIVLPIGITLGPLFLTGLRLILMVMVLPLLFRLFSGAFGRVFASDWLFLGYLFWATLSLLVNNPETVIEQTGSAGVEFLGGYVIGRALIRDKATFVALARALILIVLCLMPFAVAEALTGRSLILEVIRALPGLQTVAEVNATPRNLFGVTLERVQVGFTHPIHFGLFCSVTFSMCVVALRATMNRTRRWVIGGAIAVTGCLALSSGAILAIGLQISLICWAIGLRRYPARWWILCAMIVFGYCLIDLLSNRKPLHVFLSYATFSAHTAYWRAITFEWGLVNIWMNPMFGIGFHDWVRPEFMYSDSIDNFWLLTTMRYGIPAFLCLSVGYILVLVHLMRRDFHADPCLQDLRLAWVFTFIGLSFTLCTVHVWTAIFSFTFFLMGAGMWMITAYPDDTTSPQNPVARRTRLVHRRNFPDSEGDRVKRHRFTRF